MRQWYLVREVEECSCIEKLLELIAEKVTCLSSLNLKASKPISGEVSFCFSFLSSEDEVALKESVLDKAVTYNALPKKKW